MAVNKTLNSRITSKHDTEANWSLAINFIPLKGEIIVYNPDDNYSYVRIKIGDGVRTVSNLPFVGEEKVLIKQWTASEFVS